MKGAGFSPYNNPSEQSGALAPEAAFVLLTRCHPCNSFPGQTVQRYTRVWGWPMTELPTGLRLATVLLCVLSGTLLFAPLIPAQTALPSQVITANSTVVLVPAMVTTKQGEPVFTLTAKDFTLTDDGITQPLILEENAGDEPLALVVAIQTGGDGARQLAKYRTLPLMIDAIVGQVPHKIAIVSFGSVPKLDQDFTSDSAPIEAAIHHLDPGDDGAAILDTLGFSVDLLKEQPQKYRRAILLLSQTLDSGSRLKLEDALRVISDTNTAIYSLTFSTVRSDAARKSALALNNPNPGPRHGCMSKDTPPETGDPEADQEAADAVPARTGKQVANQAYDCLGLLLPPLALAKIAVTASLRGLQHNVPETVAELTGGEYFHFKDAKTMERDMQTISNHVPNRYMLSFHPQSPHSGLHAVSLRLNDYPNLDLAARNSYWVEGDPSAPSLH
jgi:VWFA-related protein